MKRVVIFGAASAIAQCFARELAAEGSRFYLIARNEMALGDIANDLLARGAKEVSVRVADLADLDALPALCALSRNVLGGIDIALVAHGVLPDQGQCEVSPDAVIRLMQINTLSPMILMGRLAKILTEQGMGALLVISSVAGDRGRPSNYVYGASKASLSVMGEGLALSLASKGVDVLVVKPGFVDTPMTATYKKGPLWRSPEDVASVMLNAIKSRKRGVIYAPGWWRLIMLVVKFAPGFLVRRL